MAFPALFNALERTFAPQDVIARQRNEFLNLAGAYDSDASTQEPAMTQATPSPQPTSEPDKAWLIHQAQGRIGPVAASGSIAPTGRSFEPDWPAAGTLRSWSPLDDIDDPYSGITRRHAGEKAWDDWAQKHNLDRLAEAALLDRDKESYSDFIRNNAWLNSDPRWHELPSNWTDGRKRAAIKVMRGMTGGG